MSKIINYVKKSTALILVAIMLGGIFTPTIAFASERISEDFLMYSYEDLLMNEFVDHFSEDYFEIENVNAHLNEIAIEVSAEDFYGSQISAEVEFTLGGQYIFVTTQEYNAAGFLEEREYWIDLSHIENSTVTDLDHVDLVINDVQMGEEVLIEPFVHLPEAGIGLAYDLMGRMMQIGQLAIIEGVSWLGLTVNTVAHGFPNFFIPLEIVLGGLGFGNGLSGGLFSNGGRLAAHQANDTHAMINAEVHTYFDFMVLNGELYIGEGMDVNEAANRIRNGENVWSATATDAREAARLAGYWLPSLIHNDARNGFRSEVYLDYIFPNPRTGGRAYFGLNLRGGWW